VPGNPLPVALPDRSAPGASWLDLALVSGVIVALQVTNHFGQMVDGEDKLWICAVVALLYFGRRKQAHAGAIIDPRVKAPEVFGVTKVLVIIMVLDCRFALRKFDHAHDCTIAATALLIAFANAPAGVDSVPSSHSISSGKLCFSSICGPKYSIA
jgi:hypothetical protein